MNFLNYMGGASFIIIIMKIIIDYFIKTELTQRQKESAKEIEILKDKLESKTFISNMQYQKEFDIYLELFEKLTKAIVYTNSPMPKFDSVPLNRDEALEMYQKRYSNYIDSLNDLKVTRMRYAPFYMESINIKLLEIIKQCDEQGIYFEEMKIRNDIHFDLSEKKEAYGGIISNLDKLQKEIEKEIRDYLKSLIIN